MNRIVTVPQIGRIFDLRPGDRWKGKGPAFFELGQEMIQDPGIEFWADSHTPLYWARYTTGGTVVNQDGNMYYSYPYSARVDVDGSNSDFYISVNPPGLQAGRGYRCSVWVRTTAGKSAYIYAQSWDGGQNHVLASKTIDTAGAWQQVMFDVWPPWPDLGWVFARGQSASSSLYFDEASMRPHIFGTGYQLGPELLVDGSFERWWSTTQSKTWAESVAGTSTINRTGSAKSGNWAMRMDVDGSNSYAQATQYLDLVSLKTYRLGVWYNAPVGASVAVGANMSINGVMYYLQENDEFQKPGDLGYAGAIILSGTGAWTYYSTTFHWPGSVDPGSSCFWVKRSGGCQNKSLYFDDISLRQVLN